PIKLTTEDIKNTKAYKEYYACATGEAAPKPKASARRKRGGYVSSTTPPTPIATPTPITTVMAAPRLTAAAKGKQQVRATSPTDPSDVEQTEAQHLKIVLRRSMQETHGGSSTDEGTGSKPRVPDVPSDDLEAEISWNSFDDEDGRGLQVSQEIEDSHVTLTPVHSDGQQESSLTSSFVTSLLNPIIDPNMESIFTTASQPPITPTPIPSEALQNLPTFASVFRFEDRVKSLEVNFLEFKRTNQFPEAVSNIRVKSQVKAQVSRILPRIEETVNAQLEAEVLTRSSHSSRTSYAVAADLSKMELKKILIDKMEGNKSI
nr:hypothetical protein [Tanacetum cinerariifolium]